LERAIEVVRTVNARAPIVRAASPVHLDDPGAVRGRRALVIEDGPTLTHGSMPYGAGFVAANAAGAIVVDPRSAATPGIQEVFTRYPHIGPVLPALGYSAEQLDALRATIDRVEAEVVIAATPVDLARLITFGKQVIRARYEFAEAEEPGLGALVDDWLAGRSPRSIRR
jgi:predicted GTPase